MNKKKMQHMLNYILIISLCFLPMYPINSDADAERVLGYLFTVTIIYSILSIIIYFIKDSNETDNNYSEKVGLYYKMDSTHNDKSKEEILLDNIKKNDEYFEYNSFLSFAKKILCLIFDGVSKNESIIFRHVLIDEIFNQYENEIEQNKEKNYAHIQEDVVIKIIELVSYRVEKDNEFIDLNILLSLHDYIKDTQNGNIIEGFPKVYTKKIYKVTFMRKVNVKTNQDIKENVCPNCGANISINLIGKCEYCNSVITTGEYNWVLSDIKVINKEYDNSAENEEEKKYAIKLAKDYVYKPKKVQNIHDFPIKKNRTEEISNNIRKSDTYFSDEKILKWSEDVFLEVAKAFSNNEFDSLHIFESNELFEKHKNMIYENIGNGISNKIEQVKFLYHAITDYNIENDNEILEIELHCIVRDYSSQSAKIAKYLEFKDYKEKILLTFARKEGIKTNKEELNIKKCPNCNSASDISFVGKCEYCNQIISTGTYRWVLINIKKVSKNSYYNLK